MYLKEYTMLTLSEVRWTGCGEEDHTIWYNGDAKPSDMAWGEELSVHAW